MASKMKFARVAGAAALLLVATSPAFPADSPAGSSITVASTTSTENSGLLAWLLPVFEKDSGVYARVVAVGTGQAIRLARNGDVDVVLVHHRPSEESLVADGIGIMRVPVMHNDFVLIGPSRDPANIGNLDDVVRAMGRIGASAQLFASRGDNSGTHEKELELWRAAGIGPASLDSGWYRETGSGQGATLNIASGIDAYALSDRATWMKFGNKGDLKILIEGDARLHNAYSVILINPAKYPHVNVAGGQAFVDWLVSEKGQHLIGEFTIDGRQVFFPDVIHAVVQTPESARSDTATNSD
jgi:tungstate transport system substrate-binding protein